MQAEHLFLKTFKVRITETLSKVVEVEAVTAEEAISTANENYIKAEPNYILGYNDYQGVETEIEE